MIDRVWVTKHLHQMKARSQQKFYNQGYNILFDDELDISRLPQTHYLTPELMLDWLKRNSVLEVIFGDNAHTEIVKRANVLLQFYAKQSKGHLDQEIVELTWRCQEGKHEEMVRCIQKLII